MRRRSLLFRRVSLLALAIVLAAPSLIARPAHAATRLHAPEVFPMPLPGLTPGDLAVGDVDGDGFPELATYANDLKVHVFSREGGVWAEVYVSTTPVLSEFGAPTVRFTDIAAIAPGAPYDQGQFLFNCASRGIVSIRRASGTWSELQIVEPLYNIGSNGIFSPPVRLVANHNSTPAWRLAVPGKVYFDPPMRVYLPEFGAAAPYPFVVHNVGPGGYCTQMLDAVPAADAGDVDGNGSNELALLINTNELWLANTFAATASTPYGCWSFEKFTLPNSPYHRAVQMIAGKFDGDAADDFVVRDMWGGLYLMRGTPGTLPYQLTASTLPALQPAGTPTATDMDVADLDGDGDLDIVQAYASPAGYKVLLNDGTGTFTESFTPFPNPADTVGSVALADVDGDSRPDLVLAMSAVANPRVLIIPSGGAGEFGPAFHALGSLDPASLALGDFNGDLRTDLVVGGQDLDDSDGWQPIQIWLNPGTGPQAPPNLVSSQYAYYEYVRQMSPHRPSPGGALCLAIIGSNSFATVQGNGDGSMQPFAAPGGNPKTGVDAADMEGDGWTETIMLQRDNTSGTSFIWFERNGEATGYLELPNTHDGVRAVDWNSDGVLDVVTLNLDLARLEVWLMDPYLIYTFPTLLTYPVTVPLNGWEAGGWRSFIVMPFAPASTRRTVVVRSGSGFSPAQMEVFHNEGWTSAIVYDVSASAYGTLMGVAGGDVDGDGVPDVVAGENVGGSDGLLTLMRGVAGFPDLFEKTATFVLPGRALVDFTIGDVTGDGFDDLVTATNLGAPLMAAAREPARATGPTGTGEFALFPGLPVPVSTTGVDGDPRPGLLPQRLALAIAPNPARHETATLAFALPAVGHAEAALFDLAGRRVRELFRGERAAGSYTERVALQDASGRPLVAGVYFVRLAADRACATRRFVVMR